MRTSEYKVFFLNFTHSVTFLICCTINYGCGIRKLSSLWYSMVKLVTFCVFRRSRPRDEEYEYEEPEELG